MELEKILKLSLEERIKIINSESIFQMILHAMEMTDEKRRNEEYFWFVGSDDNYNLACFFAEKYSLVDAFNLMREANRRYAKNAVIVRNVINGDIKPVKSDIDVLEKFIIAGKGQGIQIKDYLIMSYDKYTSFEKKGHIKRLGKLFDKIQEELKNNFIGSYRI